MPAIAGAVASRKTISFDRIVFAGGAAVGGARGDAIIDRTTER